jgi:uncharacterized protein (DUF2141 family)
LELSRKRRAVSTLLRGKADENPLQIASVSARRLLLLSAVARVVGGATQKEESGQYLASRPSYENPLRIASVSARRLLLLSAIARVVVSGADARKEGGQRVMKIEKGRGRRGNGTNLMFPP